MKRSVICIFLILLLVVPLAVAKTVGTVNVPETFDAGGTKLILNGAGIREKTFMELLVYAMYLKAKSSDAEAIINADEPMAVKAWIYSEVLNSDNLTAGYNDMFIRSMGRDKAKFKNEIDTFNSIFKEEVKLGDVYEFVYIPGVGTKTYKNGKHKDTIKGLEFKKGLFGGWLASNAEDTKLKGFMLGY